ncbi:hypothetical protein KC349_g7195 [Hortaea werneckii]|nr:hypothetical protein KC349_g7195 [Hortaea werneckii]
MEEGHPPISSKQRKAQEGAVKQSVGGTDYLETMFDPPKDGLARSTEFEAVPEPKRASEQERPPSAYSMSGGVLPERMATAENPESASHHFKDLPLRAKEPQTSSHTAEADTSKGKSYSNTARMFHAWNKHLRGLSRGGKYRECREECLHLLESPYVPGYTRIETLQLLSSVSGSAALAQLYLEDAQRRLDKLDSSKKYVSILLNENRTMMATVEAHVASDSREKQDDLAEDMAGAGGDSHDNPPDFTEQDPAALSTEAEGFDADMEAFLAERDEQERWESTIFQDEDEEGEDDHDPIEKELAKKREKAEQELEREKERQQAAASSKDEAAQKALYPTPPQSKGEMK